MSESKKYYWLKLKEDFFGTKHVKYIRSQEDGDRMTIVYLELQLKSLKSEGVVNYDKILPSCIEEIAFDLGEPVEIVQKTISTLEHLKLVELLDDGSLYLSAVKEVTGSETAAAERKRKQREKEKLQGDSPLIDNPFKEWPHSDV